MVNYFTNCVAQLRERSVYVQFSNHKELKTDQTHSNASASAQAALQAAQALTGTDQNGGKISQVGQPIATTTSTVNTGGQGSGGPNTVLRVIVEHMVYPVTLDVIYQIFSRVGKVLKIVTFTKNNTFQVYTYILTYCFKNDFHIYQLKLPDNFYFNQVNVKKVRGKSLLCRIVGYHFSS